MWNKANKVFVDVDLDDPDEVTATAPGRCNCCKTITSAELVCGDLHICEDCLGEDGRAAFDAFRVSTCNPLTVQRQNALVQLAIVRLELLQSLRTKLDTATTRPKLVKLRKLVSTKFGSFAVYLDTVLRLTAETMYNTIDYTCCQRNMQTILAAANASWTVYLCCITHLGHANLMDANYDRNAHYMRGNYTSGETIARGEAVSSSAVVPAASAFADSLQRVASAVTQSDDDDEVDGKSAPASGARKAARVMPIDSKGQVVCIYEVGDKGTGWVIPGGKFDPSKDTCHRDTAVREFEEETVLSLDPSTLVDSGRHDTDGWEIQHYTVHLTDEQVDKLHGLKRRVNITLPDYNVQAIDEASFRARKGTSAYIRLRFPDHRPLYISTAAAAAAALVKHAKAVCVIPMCEHGTYVLSAVKIDDGPKATAPTGIYEVSNETVQNAAVRVFHEGFGCTRTVISAKALRYCCETSTSIDGIDYKTTVYTVWVAADHLSKIPITIQCTYTDLANETTVPLVYPEHREMYRDQSSMFPQRSSNVMAIRRNGAELVLIDEIGGYDSIVGKVNTGETYAACAVRIWEETVGTHLCVADLTPVAIRDSGGFQEQVYLTALDAQQYMQAKQTVKLRALESAVDAFSAEEIEFAKLRHEEDLPLFRAVLHDGVIGARRLIEHHNPQPVEPTPVLDGVAVVAVEPLPDQSQASVVAAAEVSPPPSVRRDSLGSIENDSLWVVWSSTRSRFSARSRRATVDEVAKLFEMQLQKRPTATVTTVDGVERLGYKFKNFVVVTGGPAADDRPLEVQFPTAASVNDVPWSLWEKASDGEVYELLAETPGSQWCYGTAEVVKFSCLRLGAGKVSYVLKPPPVEKPKIQFTDSAKEGKHREPKRGRRHSAGTDSSDQESDVTSQSESSNGYSDSESESGSGSDASSGIDVDCQRLLALVVDSEEPSEEHGVSEDLQANIRRFQRQCARVKGTLKQLNGKKFRKNGEKKVALKDKLEMEISVREERHGVVKVQLRDELQSLKFPEGEALELKVPIGEKRLRKAIERLNLSGNAAMDKDAEMSDRSLHFMKLSTIVSSNLSF